MSMGERNIYRPPLVHAPPRDRTCYPGRCPDQESNQGPFSLRNDTQFTESHWPGHIYDAFKKLTSFKINYKELYMTKFQQLLIQGCEKQILVFVHFDKFLKIPTLKQSENRPATPPGSRCGTTPHARHGT